MQGALKEWGGNYDNKFFLGCQVMDNTGIQLHQGSHPVKFDEKEINKRLKTPVLPIKDAAGGSSSDEDEMDGIETSGYLDKVKKLLNNVHSKVLVHVSTCTDKCKQKKKGKKDLVLPLESTVEMMNQVSYILKVLVDARVIYVSWYAYAHAFDKKLIYGQPENLTLSDEMAELLKSKLRTR